jgi:RND family efflux transporter MFP subunit
MKALLIALAAMAVGVATYADAQPSVLVQTQMPKWGSIPNKIVTHGSAAPVSTATETLSLQQPGQVSTIFVRPGALVHAGNNLLQFTTSPTAISSYRQALAALELARTQQAHMVELAAHQLATLDQVAQAEAAVKTAEAALQAILRDGADQASIMIKAPFDGLIASIPVAQGDRIAPGAALVTIARSNGLIVTVGVEPRDRQQVRVGQNAELESLLGGDKLQGRVVRVGSMLNPLSRLIDADVAVREGSVLSGDAFRAAITVDQTQGWLVPHDAVLTDNAGTYVFQVSGVKAMRVAVRIALTTDTTDVVTGPLDARLPLVVQGNYQLQTGSVVRTSNAP